MDSIDERIHALARDKHGVFTSEEAGAAGLSRQALHHRLRTGRIRLLHRGVYFVGAAVTLEALRWAAVLAGGPDARLAGQAAEEDWGLARHGVGAVEILVVKRQRPLDGVDVRRTTTLHDEDRVTRNGRPTTSVERMLVDVADRRGVYHQCWSIREARFHGVLDLSRLERTIERNAGRTGIQRLRRALELHLHGGHNGTDGRLETRFARLLHSHGVTDLVTNKTFHVGGETLRVDLFIPTLLLVAEVDPDFHDMAPIRREDRLRAALCRTIGLTHESVSVEGMAAAARDIARRWHAARRLAG